MSSDQQFKDMEGMAGTSFLSFGVRRYGLAAGIGFNGYNTEISDEATNKLQRIHIRAVEIHTPNPQTIEVTATRMDDGKSWHVEVEYDGAPRELYRKAGLKEGEAEGFCMVPLGSVKFEEISITRGREMGGPSVRGH